MTCSTIDFFFLLSLNYGSAVLSLSFWVRKIGSGSLWHSNKFMFIHTYFPTCPFEKKNKNIFFWKAYNPFRPTSATEAKVLNIFFILVKDKNKNKILWFSLATFVATTFFIFNNLFLDSDCFVSNINPEGDT